ncbi:MAG: tetratricopeptide repeat protein [Solirubrobacteraceae bacterium]
MSKLVPATGQAREGIAATGGTDAAQAGIADHPAAYIARDRRRALARGSTLPARARGAALFADISGFTPLVEALANELGSQRASEVLTGHLNRVFGAVIEELDRYGGDVIYFSGDAITCWLDGDDGSRAAASGVRMLGAIEREGRITTPGGLAVQLALKVAVVVGDVRRFVVGDPEIQLIDVLAGSLLDRLAESEHLTEKGEVVLHESALAALEGRVALGETRASPEAGSVSVLERLIGAVPELMPSAPDVELPGQLTRSWLPPTVYERLASGSGEFLAELRPAYPMFVRFGGIDYDHDEAASERLDEFIRAAERVLSGYGGSVVGLTIGDKGAYLYAVFGTPIAHEDDAARACAAGLDLLGLEESTAAREIQVGITHGRLRSGTYGHARRRAWGCLGDAVNLAARLMSKAPAGSIYVSEPVRRSAGDGFAWTALEPLVLKGKAAPVPAYVLEGSAGRQSRRARGDALPMVGRSGELARLDAALHAAQARRGRILGVSAEAGMGKSRLVAELVDEARVRGVTVASGECQSYGTSAAYFVWRDVWRTLFGLDQDAPAVEQVTVLEAALRQIEPSLVPRAPLLDALLGLTIPDTELTSSFDPKLRKTSLENMLSDCLRAIARREPLVVVLEDCHWLDALSRDLLGILAATVASAAVLLLVVYRPEAALPQGLALAQLPDIEELELAALDEDAMTAIVESKLARVLGDGAEADASLRDLVVGRAQGNPFYAEELINYVHDQGVDASDESALRALALPESLHSLVLGRIDTLTEAPRRTIKVASVVGRVFRAPILPGVYPELGQLDDVRGDLATLRLADLVSPDREADESYLFKHAVTHEVAYESIPYALRATLHRSVGRYLEGEGDAGEQMLDLLAYHFWHSDDEQAKRIYLLRAAQAAQASYANAAAIDYYERLAPLLPDTERIDVLLELCSVLELVGQWDRARATATGALELAEAIGDERLLAWCEAAIAEVARKQNHFDEAAERLGRAALAFQALGEDEGLGKVLHLEGTLAAQRGNNAEARSRYEESLELRRRVGDRKMMASVLSNLGIVAEYDGDYALARSFHEQALELRTELADRWAIAVSMTNLGMIASLQGRNEEARGRFEEAMRLNREVGDSWMVAISHNNLGNANRGLHDYAAAREDYAASLLAHRRHNDGWALAFLLEDVGRLAALTGEPQLALTLLGAADALREEIGAPRAAALEQEIAADIEPAVAALGPELRAQARARGRGLSRVEAIETALPPERGG